MQGEKETIRNNVENSPSVTPQKYPATKIIKVCINITPDKIYYCKNAPV